jgi:hypothetical protein
MGRRKNIAMLRLHLKQNWLQVLGGTETPQIDERVRHQLHAVVGFPVVTEIIDNY